LDWLAAVWARGEVREALAWTSPALCGQVEALLAAASSPPARIRRAALSVASYLLRWQRRPTPFALFAGVGPARGYFTLDEPGAVRVSLREVLAGVPAETRRAYARSWTAFADWCAAAGRGRAARLGGWRW
jgi:hypothetical protein